LENIEIKKIKEILDDLDNSQKLSFGYLLCKKLFPDYVIFSEYENFGKPDILYSALIELRKNIIGIDNKIRIEQLINNLWENDDVTPDTDDFPSNISASLALNVVSCIYHCLKYVTTSNIEFIYKVSELSLESVIMYFVVNNNINQNLPKLEYQQIIHNSIFVQSEIQLQINLIEKIKNINNLNNNNYLKIKIKENKLVENSLYSQFVYI